MAHIQQDMAGLGDALAGEVRNILGSLIEGSIKDLDGPIREISARLAMAAKRKRPDLVEACKDQLSMIVIEKELEVRSGVGDAFDSILNLGLNALVNGAIGGLGAIKVVG